MCYNVPTMQTFIADFVEAYINQGLKPIPLHHSSKRPIGAGWNQEWSADRCREGFYVYPNANIGILLGDVVDVEGDDEFANDLLTSLIGTYPHPTWRSSKSVHHLFQSPDPDLTRIVYKNIEFRGRGHQSVVPPSFVAETGARYQWLNTTKFPVPAMPEPLLDYYQNLPRKQQKKRPEKKEPVFGPNHRSSVDPAQQYLAKHYKFKYDVKPGHKKLWCADCGEICFIHKKRLHLEMDVLRFLGLKWTCNECRTHEFKEWLRDECRKLRKTSR